MIGQRELLSAEETFESGAGFVVAGHNYGRLDRASLEDLAELSSRARQLGEEIYRLQEGVRIAQLAKLDEEAQKIKEKYGC